MSCIARPQTPPRAHIGAVVIPRSRRRPIGRRLSPGSRAENYENVGLSCTYAPATDRHGSQATGRRYVVVVRHGQRERHQTPGIAAKRFQVPVHGDEEEVSADQRGTCRCRPGRAIDNRVFSFYLPLAFYFIVFS